MHVEVRGHWEQFISFYSGSSDETQVAKLKANTLTH